MAFSKKKKRKIVVNDEKYYWSATGNDGWVSLSIMTQIEGSSRLICSFRYHQIPIEQNTNNASEFTLLTNQFVITPHTVRKVIEYALSKGWNPFDKGDDLNLSCIDDFVDLRFDKNRANNFKK